MFEEFLLNLPFREEGCYLWLASMCTIVWVLQDEKSRRVFRDLERDVRETWAMVRFHVSQ